MLERGATTLWETWAESDNVYSQNHPMFGSVSEWFYKGVGGIRPAQDAVGFNRFEIIPGIWGDLSSAEASYESVRGTISSGWRLVGDRKSQLRKLKSWRPRRSYGNTRHGRACNRFWRSFDNHEQAG